MKVKEQLIKAGRLEDVIEMLKNTEKLTGIEQPVYFFVDSYGIVRSRVSTEEIKAQARILINQIVEDDDVTVDTFFEDLHQYSKSTLEMRMHNYANYALHRIESNVDLNDLRILAIIESILNSVSFCDSEELPFDIPSGWAAESK